MPTGIKLNEDSTVHIYLLKALLASSNSPATSSLCRLLSLMIINYSYFWIGIEGFDLQLYIYISCEFKKSIALLWFVWNLRMNSQ